MFNKKEWNKQWYLNHKDEKHKYYLDHKDKYEENKHRPDYMERQRLNSRRYYQNNTDACNERARLYRKTPKGKESMSIGDSKHKAKRHRNLGWNIVKDNIIEEPIDWHHVNNTDVVAIPKDLHQLYPGRNVDNHRFMVNQIVVQIYN
jgi:hypothetical protein